MTTCGVVRSIPVTVATVVFLSAAAVPGDAGPGPSLAPADRPVYAIGQVWLRDDGTYKLVRIDDDVYVFSAGEGREVRLTRDLGLVRVQREGTFFEFAPPVSLTWPIAVGRWGTGATTRTASGNLRGARVNVTWRVEGTDGVTIGGTTVAAYRILVVQNFVVTGRQTVQRLWYAPDVRQFVRSAGDDWKTFQFAVVGLPGDDERLAGGPREPLPIEVRRATGVVEVQQGSGGWRRAIAGDRLGEGDQVRTGEGGIVELVLTSGAGMTAYPQTSLVLSKLEHDPRSGARNVSVHVSTGAVRVVRGGVSRDRSRPSTFMVSTPSGVAAVRGGVSAVVSHEESKKESVVAAASGEAPDDAKGFLTYVDFVSSSVQTIRPGQFVRQETSKSPSRPTSIESLPQDARDRLPLTEK